MKCDTCHGDYSPKNLLTVKLIMGGVESRSHTCEKCVKAVIAKPDHAWDQMMASMTPFEKFCLFPPLSFKGYCPPRPFLK